MGRSGGNHVRSLQKNQISKVIALEQWHLKEINSQKKKKTRVLRKVTERVLLLLRMFVCPSSSWGHLLPFPEYNENTCTKVTVESTL